MRERALPSPFNSLLSRERPVQYVDDSCSNSDDAFEEKQDIVKEKIDR